MAHEILTGRLDDATVWYAKDMKAKNRWLHPVSPSQQEELLHALDTARQMHCTVATVTRENFPLPEYSRVLSRIAADVENGIGLRVLRGLPIAHLSVDEIELMFAGLTSHLGKMINQDTRGTLVGHVCDQGASYESIEVRGYTTNAQLTPHCDSGDLLGLLCVRPAREGGLNNFSCAMAVYNEILDTYPQYLLPLYRGFYYNIRGNGPEGKYRDITSHRVPVFIYHRGRLSCRYNQKAILTSQELDHSEPLSELEEDAVNCVAEMAMRDDIRFDTYLEAGDVALINNNTVLHNRAAFVDHDETEKKRLLLRQWINLDRARELPFHFADHYNTGPRRGPALRPAQQSIEKLRRSV